jgi:enterobactin synthetase component F
MEKEEHIIARKEKLPSPTTSAETLRRLWTDILDLPDISFDDDFFLCGGNSLTAIELLIKIQREYHINLPPDSIYRYPTIKKQVGMLRKKAATAREYHPLIFPLRDEGTLPPLFCIHPLGGWMDHYLKILTAIDSDRPVYGIRGRGLEPGEVLPITVEDTAREQVDAIRTVRKTGPYYLLGFSNGGILAFELACQLQEQGDEISFLGLIDVSAPGTEVRYFKTLAATLFPGPVLGKIPAFFEAYLKAHPDSKIYAFILNSIRSVFRKGLSRKGAKSLPESVRDRHAAVHYKENALAHFPKESHANMIVQLNASRIYIPHTFRGDLVLFSAGLDHMLYPGDVTRGWRSLITGTCEVIEVPGDHTNLFDEPHISILRERISAKLAAFR